jgi:hypothetical protein
MTDLNAVTVDTTTTTTPDFGTLGRAIASAHKRGYGAMVAFASALATQLGGEWYKVEATDKTELAGRLAPIKSNLFAQLKKAEHSNPSEVWKQLRAYGARAAGVVSGAAPEASEQDTKKPDSTKRELSVRLVEDLLKLRKAIKAHDTVELRFTECDKYLALALRKLAVEAKADEPAPADAE